MKICFYCDSIFSFGGVQRVLAGVASALSQKHKVTVLTCDDPATEDLSMYNLQAASVRFRYLRYMSPRWYEYFPCKFYSFLYKKVLPHTRWTSRGYALSSFPWSQRKQLLRFLQEEDYDVIIGVHAYPALRIASLQKYLRAALVGWLHTSVSGFFHQPGVWLCGIENYFRYQMSSLHKMIVLTQYDSVWYRSQMGLKTDVIYNPLGIVADGKGSLDHKKMLAVGRLVMHTKGFDLLLQAFNHFAHTKEGEGWSLEIIGEGPDEEQLRELIGHYRLERQVTICPFTQDISRHYRLASVFILSSRWEGFPLALFEAMAFGLPVIAADLPVVKEVLEGKGNAMIFSKDNESSLSGKMKEMSRLTPAEWAEMSEASCKIVQKLTMPEILEEWERLLTDVTEHKKL